MSNHRARKGKVDEQVLKLLQSNPHLTQQEISERLRVARGTVASALSRLKEDRLILGNGFILNSPQDTGFKARDCFGFVLISNAYNPEDQEELERLFRESYSIGVTHMITGKQYSYMFSLYVAHNSQEFLDFIKPVRKLADTETHPVVTCF